MCTINRNNYTIISQFEGVKRVRVFRKFWKERNIVWLPCSWNLLETCEKVLPPYPLLISNIVVIEWSMYGSRLNLILTWLALLELRGFPWWTLNLGMMAGLLLLPLMLKPLLILQSLLSLGSVVGLARDSLMALIGTYWHLQSVVRFCLVSSMINWIHWY